MIYKIILVKRINIMVLQKYTVLHSDNSLSMLSDIVIMGNQKDCSTLFLVKLNKELHHFSTSDRIESSCWFIGKDKSRLGY